MFPADQKFSVYFLRSPESPEVRYVGITCRNPKKRLQNHFSDSHNLHKMNWLKKLKRDGLYPSMEVVFSDLVLEDAGSIETSLISFFRRVSDRLLNASNGGEKTMLGFKFSQESLGRMRESHLGHSPSEDTRKKLSLANAGRPKPEGFGAKLSKLLVGKKRTPEMNERQRQLRLGSKQTLETRQKRSESLKLSWAKRKAAIACS